MKATNQRRNPSFRPAEHPRAPLPRDEAAVDAMLYSFERTPVSRPRNARRRQRLLQLANHQTLNLLSSTQLPLDEAADIMNSISQPALHLSFVRLMNNPNLHSVSTFQQPDDFTAKNVNLRLGHALHLPLDGTVNDLDLHSDSTFQRLDDFTVNNVNLSSGPKAHHPRDVLGATTRELMESSQSIQRLQDTVTNKENLDVLPEGRQLHDPAGSRSAGLASATQFTLENSVEITTGKSSILAIPHNQGKFHDTEHKIDSLHHGEVDE